MSMPEGDELLARLLDVWNQMNQITQTMDQYQNSVPVEPKYETELSPRKRLLIYSKSESYLQRIFGPLHFLARIVLVFLAIFLLYAAAHILTLPTAVILGALIAFIWKRGEGILWGLAWFLLICISIPRLRMLHPFILRLPTLVSMKEVILAVALSVVCGVVWGILVERRLRQENMEIQAGNQKKIEENRKIQAYNEALPQKNLQIRQRNAERRKRYQEQCVAWRTAMDSELERQQQILCQLCWGWFPPDYCYMEAVEYFFNLVKNYRANTVQEMVNMYEHDLAEQRRIEEQQAMYQQVLQAMRQQRRQAEVMYNVAQRIELSNMYSNMLQSQQLSAMRDIRSTEQARLATECAIRRDVERIQRKM